MTDFTTALNAGDPAFSCGFWIRMLSPAGCLKSSYRMVSARPDSPGPDVSKTMVCWVMATLLIAKITITNASQPKIAFLR